MAGKRRSTKPRQVVRRVKDLPKLDFDVNYKNYELLGKFVSDRAKLYGRKRTGLSASQQRALARAVKQARHLGLLPFKGGL